MTISSDLKVERKTLTYHEPTSQWLRAQHPIGKNEILKWYENRSRLLELRRQRAIRIKYLYFEWTVDAETKQMIGKKRGPLEIALERWKLSEKDYLFYKRGLEEQFSRLKREHNQKVRAEKQNQKEI